MSAKPIQMQQAAIADDLARQYGIDRNRVYFLNDRKPLDYWIPPDQLTIAARIAGGFQSLEERFDTFNEKLNQIFHTATVIDEQGRTFVRTGVARLGERTPAGEDFDEHQLAGGRAISAVLTAAGCNPFKSVEKPANAASIRIDETNTDNTIQRNADLSLIHGLAQEAGLIVFNETGGGKDSTSYRHWLRDTCRQMGLGDDVNSAVGLDQKQRACVINALREMVALGEV